MKSGILRKVVGGAVTMCLLGTATAPLAWAHHSSSNFDMSKSYIFKGTVRKWLWVNPHAWLYVNVRKADGTTELWGFETAGPGMLSRGGWSATVMKPGDPVTIYGNPDKKGVRNGAMMKVVLADGRELGMGGPSDEPPPGVGGTGPGGPEGGPPPGLFPSGPAVEYK